MKKGDSFHVSAVYGVIVITIATIIIAAFTYYHIETINKSGKTDNLYIEGLVLQINKNLSFKTDVWDVILDQDGNRTLYHMIFNETYPPIEGINLRFYYKNIIINDMYCYMIYEVEQI